MFQTAYSPVILDRLHLHTDDQNYCK